MRRSKRRAAERGRRGFAVVASEVKSLASNRQGDDQIGAQVSSIQNSSSEAVTAIRTISASDQ